MKSLFSFPHSKKSLCSESGILGLRECVVGSGFGSESRSRRQPEGKPLPRPFTKDKIAGVMLLQGLEWAK